MIRLRFGRPSGAQAEVELSEKEASDLCAYLSLVSSRVVQPKPSPPPPTGTITAPDRLNPAHAALAVQQAREKGMQ